MLLPRENQICIPLSLRCGMNYENLNGLFVLSALQEAKKGRMRKKEKEKNWINNKIRLYKMWQAVIGSKYQGQACTYICVYVCTKHVCVCAYQVNVLQVCGWLMVVVIWMKNWVFSYIFKCVIQCAFTLLLARLLRFKVLCVLLAIYVHKYVFMYIRMSHEKKLLNSR